MTTNNENRIKDFDDMIRRLKNDAQFLYRYGSPASTIDLFNSLSKDDQKKLIFIALIEGGSEVRDVANYFMRKLSPAPKNRDELWDQLSPEDKEELKELKINEELDELKIKKQEELKEHKRQERARLEKQKSHNETDSFIEQLESVPVEYQKELTSGLIRAVGKGEGKLACLFLILPEDHFKIRLNEHIMIRVRFPVTKTPYGIIISSCVQVFDIKSPGLDEHFHGRDKHLRSMIGQDHTFLIIADRRYKIYFRRKINFDGNMKNDLSNIEKAFAKYGEQSEHLTIGDDPFAIYALQWYQNNISMQDLLHKYF